MPEPTTHDIEDWRAYAASMRKPLGVDIPRPDLVRFNAEWAELLNAAYDERQRHLAEFRCKLTGEKCRRWLADVYETPHGLLWLARLRVGHPPHELDWYREHLGGEERIPPVLTLWSRDFVDRPKHPDIHGQDVLRVYCRECGTFDLSREWVRQQCFDRRSRRSGDLRITVPPDAVLR